MKNILLFLGLLWAGLGKTSAQTTLINQNFEAATGATLANHGTNQWHRGTAAAQAGNYGLYISNNGGTSNQYTTNVTQISHAYWIVNFPAGETFITLSFNWRGVGESGYDDLRIYTSTVNPTAGNLPTGTPHATYNGQSTWQTVNLTLPGSLAGQNNIRVIFTWRNDNSVGTQPPAAIDNVVLTTAPPPPGATCSNPIVVSSYPYTHSASSSGMGNDIGVQTSSCSNFYGGGEDVVYQLNITTTGNYIIDLVNDSGTNWIGWFLKSSANCNNTSSTLACAVSGGGNIANGMYNFTTAGTYFLILDYWPPPNNSNYTLNIYLAPPPPANDNCAGAISLTPGPTCSYTAGTTAFATQSFTGCSGTADDDVWYHFVATHTTHIVQVQGGTNFDAVIQVYGGSCGGTSLTCTNVNGVGSMETVSISGLTVGATYWIRTYHAGTGSSTTPTFNICVTDPPPGDNCSSPVVVNTYPYSLSSTTLGLINNYGSQACNTSYGGGNDAVFELNISTPGPYLIDLTNTSGTGWIGWFLANTCGNTGPSLACQVSGGGNNAASVFNFSAAGTYYLIIDYYPAPTNSNYTLSIIPLVCPSGLGPTVNVAALPYSSTGRTTCGQGNELTPASAATCGSNLYFTDMDEVFVFTPTTSGMITVNLTTTSINTGLALYQGCPFSGTCVGSSQSPSASKTMCASVVAGQTYYLIVDSYNTTGGCIGSYSISISAPGASPSCVSGLGTGVVTIPALPYSVTGHSTCGMVNDLTSSNTLVCGSSSYYTAEDRVYVFTPTTTGTSTITLTSSSSWVGLMLYAGCPLSDACYGGGGTCVAQEQSSSGNQTMQVCLQAGQTYYLLVDQWASPTCIPTYNLSITAPISGMGALNDLPCAALELPMGVYVGGTNACATGAGEPGAASCWSGGTLNTVWYRFVAPSTSVKLRTILYSLTNTQIAVYSAPSCSGPFTQIGCNQNAPDCGWTSVLNSELTVTGLTVGTTYYVRVDGVNDLKGNFSIVAIDGSASFPPVNGQDCPAPVPVCSPVTAIGDPGYQAIGSTCDHTGTGNCTSGERGAAWYQININSPGALNFTIVPNDGVTDYDFVLWKIAGAGATNCANIASSGGAGAVSCNYSYLGITGVYTGGNTPPPYSGYDAAFEPTINVAAGEVYLLAVQNYSNSTSGFSLDFSHSGAGVVNYTAPTTVYWTGTASTAWDNPLNWGGCSVPDCSKNAVILPGAANQPVIDGMMIATVKDLTISPGATLTITAGSELQICGHYTNTGYLSADPGSTVRIVGSLSPQNMMGYMTTFSKFANLIIDKTNVGDNVFLYADCETAENFTVAKGNFRLNGNDHFAGGNFTVNLGGFYIPGTGSTHFNGASTQNFTNNGSCVFNHVYMVKSAASSVTLNHNMVLNATANLTLTNGWITTGTNMVIVNNPAVGAVTPGNSNSYVRGNLRRFVNTTGAYDFPVGNATLGYQRININFTTAHGGGSGGGYHYLDASFHDGTPGGTVLGVHECGNNGYDAWLYNGYWTVNGGRTDMAAVTAPGEYTAIGYPTGYANLYDTYNYTNITGNASATLAKGPVFSALALSGTCMYNSSPSTGIGRIGLSGFSDFSPVIDVDAPFPVEMTPLKAEAVPGAIRLSWETASETNNRGFDIERGTNENEFVKIGWKDGAGNSSSLRAYAFDDSDVQAGVKYYYRLRQVDFDGRARYSNVASAQLLDELKDLSVSVYPNPTDGAFILSVVSPSDRKLTIEIYDLVGRRVSQTTTMAMAGKSEVPLSLSGAAAGAYQVKVIDGEKTHVVRIQKK